MGNFFSTFISTSVDIISASLSAMVWTHIFQPYDASKSVFMSVLEGLVQLTATTLSCYWLTGILTPDGAYSVLGMVGVMFFAISFSPDMVAKLNAGHQTVKNTLGFNLPSILFSESSTQSNK